jgi:hypothetical protein
MVSGVCGYGSVLAGNDYRSILLDMRCAMQHLRRITTMARTGELTIAGLCGVPVAWMEDRMDDGWTLEARRVANFLASLPSGNATLGRADLRSLLSETGGMIMARGYLYDILSKHLGAGVYRVTLEMKNRGWMEDRMDDDEG